MKLSVCALAMLLTLVFTGCSSPAKNYDFLEAGPSLQREINQRVENLEFLHGEELVRNLQRLVWIGEPAIPDLLEALDSENPKTRGSAAYVLGELRDSRAVEALRERLDDPVPTVRYEIASSLIMIGDWNAVPVLIDGLGDPRDENRYKCITLLRERVGQDFGYVFDGPEEERHLAVTRWLTWWTTSREEQLL